VDRLLVEERITVIVRFIDRIGIDGLELYLCRCDQLKEDLVIRA